MLVKYVLLIKTGIKIKYHIFNNFIIDDHEPVCLTIMLSNDFSSLV